MKQGMGPQARWSWAQGEGHGGAGHWEGDTVEQAAGTQAPGMQAPWRRAQGRGSHREGRRDAGITEQGSGTRVPQGCSPRPAAGRARLRGRCAPGSGGALPAARALPAAPAAAPRPATPGSPRCGSECRSANLPLRSLRPPAPGGARAAPAGTHRWRRR